MKHALTEADECIRSCLKSGKSFTVTAGAGSGKTTSLVGALNFIRSEFGKTLRRDGQRVVCITYTKRACAVISERLGFDALFEVSTIHSFLWQQISRYPKEICAALKESIIPAKIERQRERDNGGNSQRAREARMRIAELEHVLENIGGVIKFEYDDSQFSNFLDGRIGHDDVIALSAHLILTHGLLRRLIGHQFPYIFVDEAQDTFEPVVAAFNAVCEPDGLPIVGYFGDPMQQIYDDGIGAFTGPTGYVQIDKEENFRSATSVISLANALRADIQQVPGPKNKNIPGLIKLVLVEAEPPLGPRKRYTDEQLDRALSRFDEALAFIEWEDHENAKRLYLVRQMIARRMGFLDLHRLFTGNYASSRAKDEYEEGTHFLLKPFVDTLCPLVGAHRDDAQRQLLDVMRDTSPAFSVKGNMRKKPLKHMLDLATRTMADLNALWESGTVREVLEFARKNNLVNISDRLRHHLERAPHEEDFDADEHAEDKSDWLADAFFASGTDGLLDYADFATDNTAFSTQHGVKGEEYADVLVVFDDVEAGWNNYSFTKLLTPGVAGEGKESQMQRSRKLAYVCFTRAKMNLRIVLFSLQPAEAKAELVKQGLFVDDQVELIGA
ncbi:MAG: UvrD-helicase domain-containing protein [Pseudomonadota bacterium]